MSIIKNSRISTAEMREQLHQWAAIILTSGLLLVLVTTLYPYDFYLNYDLFFTKFVKIFLEGFTQHDILTDILNNILLFLPLGFGVAALMQQRKAGMRTTLFVSLAAGFGLSFTVEVLQVLIPGRSSSLSDILANNAGSILGFLCFYLWGRKILSYLSVFVNRAFLSTWKLAVYYIGYAILAFLFSLYLQNAAKLDNWDQTYSLILGNEATGDRPWQGYIYDLSFVNRAIAFEEAAAVFSGNKTIASLQDAFVVSYQLDDIGKSYPDQNRNLPDLKWQGTVQRIPGSKGVFVTPDQWLQTAAPVTYLNNKIRRTSEFTLLTTIATADTTQGGPARIVSISRDPTHRNITIGQHRTDLVLRLRTLVADEDGSKPAVIFPGIFSDMKTHRLILTYRAPLLSLYVDNLQRSYSIALAPYIILFQHFDFYWRVRPNGVKVTVYRMFYYGLIFIPLGFLIALMSLISRWRLHYRLALLGVGVLLPPVLLEVILGKGRDINVENLVLGTAITIIAMLLFRMWAAPRLKHGKMAVEGIQARFESTIKLKSEA